MKIGETIKLFFTRYADFKGRACRSEFWWPAVLNMAIIFALIAAAISAAGNRVGYPGDLAAGLLIVSGIYAVLMIIPSASLYARRLHDMNQSGWLALALIPASLIPFGVLIGMFIIGGRPGTTGPNRFGPDPLNPGQQVWETFE